MQCVYVLLYVVKDMTCHIRSENLVKYMVSITVHVINELQLFEYVLKCSFWKVIVLLNTRQRSSMQRCQSSVRIQYSVPFWLHFRVRRTSNETHAVNETAWICRNDTKATKRTQRNEWNESQRNKRNAINAARKMERTWRNGSNATGMDATRQREQNERDEPNAAAAPKENHKTKRLQRN